MKKTIVTTLIALTPFWAVAQTHAKPAKFSSPATKESAADHDARMAWWRNAKFGMFIHWGVYSVPAGFYQGKPVNVRHGYGEWIMNLAKIPMAEYQQYAKEFNPVKFDADEWVRVAKDAGMKYIVITSKHHDGFAMYPTKVNAWNIYDASPWKRDPLQELAVACRKYGIKLGFYYSQAQDWNNGGSASRGKWDPAQKHDMDDYISTVAVPQVKEILTNYGQDVPAVLWWDTPTEMNPQRAKQLDDAVRAIRPDLITNNRLGGGYKGDTETPEQKIPAQGFPGRDWETCMTMNGTWGFKKDDHQWKATDLLIRNLCDIASKGGNYLLNVGPDAQGLIPAPSVERLEEVGRWMKVNGEAIYGSGPTRFGAEVTVVGNSKKKKGKSTAAAKWDWRCTTKPGKLYLMIFNWPKDGKFQLPALDDTITKAYLLADRQKSVNFSQNTDGVKLDLPSQAPDKIASVVCIETAN